MNNKSKIWTGPRVDATVDICVYCKKTNRVLLGRKESDPKGFWRLVGGFADPKDASFQEAAMRELGEEVTGINWNSNHLSHVGSFKVYDPRYKGSDDAIITTLFIYTVPTTMDVVEAEAGDDLDEIRWFELYEFVPALLPQHRPLGVALYQRLPRTTVRILD